MWRALRALPRDHQTSTPLPTSDDAVEEDAAKLGGPDTVNSVGFLLVDYAYSCARGRASHENRMDVHSRRASVAGNLFH